MLTAVLMYSTLCCAVQPEYCHHLQIALHTNSTHTHTHTRARTHARAHARTGGVQYIFAASPFTLKQQVLSLSNVISATGFLSGVFKFWHLLTNNMNVISTEMDKIVH